MQLPEEFIQQTKAMMGDELFHTFLNALHEKPSVSIRLNPSKPNTHHPSTLFQSLPYGGRLEGATPIPWCSTGYYLDDRPAFTFDPLLHAGAYYVQESSSMFLESVMKEYVADTVCMLDLCAAPGGKSTLARTLLSPDSLLISNEPIRNRAQILSENVQKWGYPQHIVTNNYPKDFRKAKMLFDVILTDVPCSGEGMFRKDEGAIREWSPKNVEHCWKLQREIVGDIWNCLRPGGILIYSTCTFNTKENEENVQWIAEELGADILPVATEDSWNITGSLLKGFDEPVYRFIPGKTPGEGLFMAVLRKQGDRETRKQESLLKSIKTLNIIPSDFIESLRQAQDAPHAELSYEQAIAYLRREAIVLPPETPRGIVVVTYHQLPLGLVKNIGTRANNLYPKEWRIKSTHIPNFQL
jgi:16S rRNA C967 or C1407 C5-methylase (RsmB/RsmF family)